MIPHPKSRQTGLMVGLFLVLMLVIFGSAWLGYRDHRREILHLMEEEALSVAKTAARAAENGLEGYREQEASLTRLLRAAAAGALRLDARRALDHEALKALTEDSRIFRAHLFDAEGRETLTAGIGGGGARTAPDTLLALVAEFLVGDEEERAINLRAGRSRGSARFSLLSRRPDGGALLLNLDARDMLALRRRVGADRVLREIGEIPGIIFAVLEDSSGVVALSRGAWDVPFPENDPFIDDKLAGGRSASRLLSVYIDPTRPIEILEAMAPLSLPGGGAGLVRLGFSTEHLEAARERFFRSLLLRSLLAILLGIALTAYLVLSAARHQLADEYERIRGDVVRLEAQRHLDEKLGAMGELARGVAHEIRNPLNVMRMVAQRLAREFRPRKDEVEYLELSRSLVVEVDRVDGIVSDFLEFARPPRPRRELGDLNALVAGQLEIFRLRAAESRVEINWDPGELPELSFDSDMMKQTTLNLLLNALEALEPGGRIHVNSRQREKVAALEIADDGPGMDEETLSRIWDLHYTTKERGTGMGLPTAHRIVREHGGRIDVDSAPGAGTRFTILLPLENS
jgi:signal transduction histidine kinase